MRTIEDLTPTERARAIDGATHQDSDGRWYSITSAGHRYGYQAHFSGAYVCYTCGHLCECGEEGE